MSVYKALSITSQAALMGMALLFSPIESTALEWTAQPFITAGTTVNDNINLETTPHNTVWTSNISPGLTLGASSARSTLSGTAQFNRKDYSDKSFSSQSNGLLSVAFTRKSERSQLSLAGNLARDSTLESELIQTGVVTTWAQRTSRFLSPSWAYFITQRDSINLGYSYSDISYSNTTSTSHLLDYTVKNPNITLSHAFTEKNKLNLLLDYSDYQTQTPVSPATSRYASTTTSVQLGFSRDFSETLNVSFMAGVHKTDAKSNGLTCLFILNSCFPVPTESNSSDTGSLFTATLQKGFESSQLTAELSRSLQPTAEGGLVQTDILSGGYSTKLTPTLNASLNMSFYDTQPSGGSSNSNNSRYYYVSPAISWQITEWWITNARYTRSVSHNENGADAAGNAINLTLTYSWPKISKSR